MWKRLDRVLTVAEDICGALAAIGLGGIMLIVASDVALRYGLGRPWPWAYDIVSIYLTVAIFYLALSRTLREHGHINVDLARSHTSVRVRHTFDLITCILSAVFFLILAKLTLRLTWEQFSDADVISSYMDWPTWLSTIFVPIGTILTVLRITINAVSHLSIIVSGDEADSIEALHGVDHSISTGE
ncbi:MAG: TRAP transporter small permease [Proteobacteria bacterium]|nr:TRAP transporter small permease [Pseudomonadota bacterium]